MSHAGLPYRPPCGGWPATRRSSTKGCYQHTRAAEKGIQEWKNDTLAVSTGLPPEPSAGAWTPSDLQSCPARDGTHAPVDLNCYSLWSGHTVDLSHCRKWGFKNVQARKTWHGRFGYFSSDPAGCTCDLTSIATDSTCMWEPQRPAADQTKYLRIDVTVATSCVQQDDLGAGCVTTLSETGSASYTGVVDPLSGRLSVTCSAVDGAGGCAVSRWADIHEYAGVTCVASYLRAKFLQALQTLQDSDPSAVQSGSYPSWSTTGAYGTQTVDIEVNVATGTYHEKTVDTDTSFGSNNEITITYTNTTVHVVVDATTYYRGCSTVTHEDLSGTLSVTYTAAQVYTDLVALLGHWDLTDDKQYPFRTDAYVTTAPLVTRNEVATPRDPGEQMGMDPTTCGSWVDWANDPTRPEANRDGNVLGGPNPAGYDRHFDWRYVELTGGTDICSGTPVYGKWTPNELPSNSPQWTQPCDASTFFPGAFLYHHGGGLWAQKWCEVKIHRPAIDWARPCGLDRFAVLANTARCVTDVTGGVATISSASPDIGTGDLVLVNASGAVGVYQVSKTSDTTYTLGPVKWTLPSDLAPSAYEFAKIRWPAAWPICGRIAVESATDESGTITIVLGSEASYLRTGDVVDFVDESDTATGVTGVTVTVIDAHTFTYTGAAPPGGAYARAHGAPHYWWFDDESKGDFLCFEWLHNFRDIGEGDRVCIQHATLSDVAMVGTECAANNPAVPAGVTCETPESDGCDLRRLQASRGMPRSVTSMTVHEDCLHFETCWPQVACFSPNGESFELGITHAFPASFSLDERYGALWQGAVEMEIQDPFWSAPAPPCTDCTGTVGPTTCGFTADDGSCTADTCSECTGGTTYYAHPPMVEARQAMPAAWMGDTAPTLPGDVVVHVLTLADLGDAVEPSGVVVPPAGAVGSALAVDPPWALWGREVNCVCGAGRFTADYKANGVMLNCP